MAPGRPQDVLGHAPGPVLPDFESTLQVGETPVLDLSHLSRNPAVKILAKCEFANPTGSIKDRMVQFVLKRAEAEGKLQAGGTIVAATSGNTGASVAMREYFYYPYNCTAAVDAHNAVRAART